MRYAMRRLVVITTLLICLGHFGQTQPYKVKMELGDIAKAIFYLPSYQVEIFHPIQGIGNLYKAIDSVTNKTIFITGGNFDYEVEDSMLVKSSKSKNKLTIIVDTAQYTQTEVGFTETYKLNTLYTSYPRQIKTKDGNGKIEACAIIKDTMITVVSQPVFITNLSNSICYFGVNNGQLRLTQQAKDKHANWMDIETTPIGGCGMVKYICELKRNDFILTSVLKFNGNYKTQLRIKLETDNQTYYSQPYTGFIDYNQINNPKIKILEDAVYERL